MGKEGSAGGRPKDIEAWKHVTVLEGKKNKVRCNRCGFEFAASTNRIKSHINQIRGKGIRICTSPLSNKHTSSCQKQGLFHSQGQRDHNKLINERMLDCYMSPKAMWEGRKAPQQVRIDTEAMHQEKVKVGPFCVPNVVNEPDLQLIQYVFERLSDRCIVFSSHHSHLCQSQLTTLRPQTHLDSWVIDIFADILTVNERREKSEVLNWYLPAMFSNVALNSGDASSFLDFVQRNNMKDTYMPGSAHHEKIFIPVRVEKNSCGHYYLYIIHMKNQEVEIWDSLCDRFMDKTERDQTTEKLLLAMDNLFGNVMFTKFERRMASNILLQPNGYDCGIFVINYMQQSDHYVRQNPLFQFDSDKERLDLALKLLKSDLNDKKENLYDKATRSHAKVRSEEDLDLCGMKRKWVDPCKTINEDVGGRGAYMEFDDSDDIGLRRCGKNCCLHGRFTEEEDNIICSLYVTIGGRWSIIASQLPGRARNDVKNYWNTKLKKKLIGHKVSLKTVIDTRTTTLPPTPLLTHNVQIQNQNSDFPTASQNHTSSSSSTLPILTDPNSGFHINTYLGTATFDPTQLYSPGFIDVSEINASSSMMPLSQEGLSISDSSLIATTENKCLSLPDHALGGDELTQVLMDFLL